MNEESTGWHDPEAHEQEPTNRQTGIRIQNLSKIYDQVHTYVTCVPGTINALVHM